MSIEILPIVAPRRKDLRWAVVGYLVLAVALTWGIRPSLDDVVAPPGVSSYHGETGRYHLNYDDTPGAELAFWSDRQGVHLRGDGLAGWGATLTISKPTLVTESVCPTGVPHVHPALSEGSEFVLAFEAKRGPRDGGGQLAAAVADQFVVSSALLCKRCWDSFVAPFEARATFQEFRVPLRAMQQAGWGVPQRATPDAQGLREIALRFGQGGPFDIVLKDFRLVRSPEKGITQP